MTTYNLTFNDWCIYINSTDNDLTEELERHCELAHSGNPEPIYKYMRKVGIENIEIDIADDYEIENFCWINNLSPYLVRTAGSKFRYCADDNIHEFEIKTDHYSVKELIETINSYQKHIMLGQNWPDSDICVMVIPKNCAVDLCDSKIRKILGFDDCVLSEGVHYGKREPTIEWNYLEFLGRDISLGFNIAILHDKMLLNEKGVKHKLKTAYKDYGNKAPYECGLQSNIIRR